MILIFHKTFLILLFTFLLNFPRLLLGSQAPNLFIPFIRVILFMIRYLAYLPNVLTFFRIGALPVICGLYFYPSHWGRILGFSLYTLACITDFLDGYLARKYKISSAIGRLLDTLADKLLLVVMAIFLVGYGPILGIHILAVILLVTREVCILSLSQYEVLKSNHVLASGYLGKWKAVFQFLFIGFFYVGNETGYFITSYENIEIFGKILLWLSVIFSLISAVSYAKGVFFSQKEQ